MVKMDKQGRALGTFANIVVYEMYGRTYNRTKSSLSRKRVLESKAFEKTRKYAGDMGRAAKIGSSIYKALPANIKDRWLYQVITGEAASMLYTGKSEQAVKDFLWAKYIANTGAIREEGIDRSGRNAEPATKQTSRKLRNIFYQRWEEQGKSYHYFKQAWDKRGYFNKERFRDTLEVMQLPHNRSK